LLLGQLLRVHQQQDRKRISVVPVLLWKLQGVVDFVGEISHAPRVRKNLRIFLTEFVVINGGGLDFFLAATTSSALTRVGLLGLRLRTDDRRFQLKAV